MHPKQPAVQLPYHDVQSHGGVPVDTPPVAGRHTTAETFSMWPRQQFPLSVTTPREANAPSDFAAARYRGLLWATAGDRDGLRRLARHPHRVQFPAWMCVTCQLEWPCAPARSNLLQSLGWVKVATFSAALLGLAVKDLRTLAPEQLWKRFIEWTEPPTAVREWLIQRVS